MGYASATFTQSPSVQTPVDHKFSNTLNPTHRPRCPENIFILREDEGMVPSLPPVPRPTPTAAAPDLKPWMVNVPIDDPELATKLKELSAAFGKKPGPYLAQVLTEWLETIDFSEIREEELPISRAS